jgi:hypothetical protein
MTKLPSGDNTGQPEFMTILGLRPPYTLEDIRAAYRAKAMDAHPDRGGSIANFLQIHEAHERALEYVHFIGDRRKWIADQVDAHLRQQEVVAEVKRLGGETKFEEMVGMKHSVGDFALLADRLRVIRLQDTAADDSFLAFLTEKPPRVPYLLEMNLAGTRITDKGLHALSGCDLLRRLDLSGTRVTERGIQAAVNSMPSLEWINVVNTALGWMARWHLRARLRKRAAEGKHRKLLIPNR